MIERCYKEIAQKLDLCEYKVLADMELKCGMLTASEIV
jgi:hypothetical protein